jgi:ATP/maltotriose-dependent transcriptional regulator MalT
VNERLDDVLASLESVRAIGGETAQAEAALLRALVALNRKRFEEATRHLITAKTRLTEEMRLHDAARKAEAKQA